MVGKKEGNLNFFADDKIIYSKNFNSVNKLIIDLIVLNE